MILISLFFTVWCFIHISCCNLTNILFKTRKYSYFRIRLNNYVYLYRPSGWRCWWLCKRWCRHQIFLHCRITWLWTPWICSSSKLYNSLRRGNIKWYYIFCKRTGSLWTSIMCSRILSYIWIIKQIILYYVYINHTFGSLKVCIERHLNTH